MKAAPPLPDMPHKLIPCVDCGAVFNHVRELVDHFRRGNGEPSACIKRQRGAL